MSRAAKDSTASAASEAGESAAHSDIAGLGYEQARNELIEVVRRLESGAVTLEESLTLASRGEALAQHCQEWLAGATAKFSSPTEADAQNPDAD